MKKVMACSKNSVLKIEITGSCDCDVLCYYYLNNEFNNIVKCFVCDCTFLLSISNILFVLSSYVVKHE